VLLTLRDGKHEVQVCSLVFSQYIDQQMHPVGRNSNSHMFQHWGAIHRKPSRTKEYKSQHAKLGLYCLHGNYYNIYKF